MDKDDRIYVAGHRGLVGSAIVRTLKEQGYSNIIARTHDELDLTSQQQVQEFFRSERPAYVFLAAAKVGGILANSTLPADFIYQNLMISTNVIHESYRHDVKKLMNLGSSCIYPRMAPQPLTEDALLSGPLEQTNEPYAVAKIAAIKMCAAYNTQHGTDFLSVMPTNLYGINDNFDLKTSHVLPALMRKIHEAKIAKQPFVTLWGDGTPRREFLYVDDLAQCVVFLMQHKHAKDIGAFVNVGTGKDLSIAELARTIKDVVGYNGSIIWDTTKPNGTPQKLLSIERIHALGWRHRVELSDGIRKEYGWFLNQHERHD